MPVTYLHPIVLFWFEKEMKRNMQVDRCFRISQAKISCAYIRPISALVHWLLNVFCIKYGIFTVWRFCFSFKNQIVLCAQYGPTIYDGSKSKNCYWRIGWKISIVFNAISRISSLRSSDVCCEVWKFHFRIRKPVCKVSIWLASLS